jgi:hypothetical protein
MQTSGVIYVHAALPAICPHVEWAISGVLKTRVALTWTAQPAAPGQLRAEASWKGERGTGARLAAALRTWKMLRFEVTENASQGQDGERICQIPGRAIWRCATSSNGDIVLTEDQILAVLKTHHTGESIRHAFSEALGADVDADLEPYRSAGEGSAVTWLHQVG